MIENPQEYGFGDDVCCRNTEGTYVINGIVIGRCKGNNNDGLYILDSFPANRIIPRRTVLVEKKRILIREFK